MSSNGIPLDTAAIVSTVLEGILYGFSVLMFGITIWVLLYDRSIRTMNRAMFTVACLLLILSTIHIIIDIFRIQEGFVVERNTFPGGPRAFFADIAQKTFVIKNVVYGLQTMLGDAVVIYRCYVVWRSPWVVVVPIIGWLGVTATCFGGPYEASQATTQASNIFYKQTGQWITAFYASTFAVNVLTTGLLAYRIWSIDNAASKVRVTRNKLLPVMRIILDAGGLYSAALLAALICFALESNGQFVVLDLITPIISIAFYMIIIRVSMERNRGSTMGTLSTSAARTGGTSTASQEVRSQDYAMHPLQVHITQLTESKSDKNTADSPVRSKAYSSTEEV